MTAITKTDAQPVFTREDIAVVKATCAPEATDAELKMFLHIARQSGLDPLRKQIHFMKYQGRVSIVADINGLQARAAREPDFEGITHACVYEKDEFRVNNVTGEVVQHTSNPFASAKGKLVGAWATVHRRGMKPFTSIVHLEEYVSSYNPLWKTKPSVMLDKCAKSSALRLAYPEQLGGIYERAELEKAKPETDVTPQAALPAPQDSIARQASAIVEQVEEAQATAQAPSIPILDHDPDTGEVLEEQAEDDVTADMTEEQYWESLFRKTKTRAEALGVMSKAPEGLKPMLRKLFNERFSVRSAR